MTQAPAWLRPAALAFALVAALLVLIAAPSIAALRYPDPDDVLRLVQVRDLLAGQGWFDLTQHRLDAPGGGVPMHWSRLVDVPLAALMLVLTPLLGAARAETVTAVVVPLLTLGCALALVGRLAARLCGVQTVLYACLAMALSVPVLSQVLPLRIDHHGWQIVLALAALTAVLSDNRTRGSWAAGAAMAAWLAISLEALPMVAAISGVLALRWLRNAEDKAWFVNAMIGLAAVSVALFLATRGLADLADHCDQMSPVHLAVLGWAGLGSMALARFDPRRKTILLSGLAAIAIGGSAILLAVAPTCARGGFAGMDPLVEQFWYRGIAEGQPLWHQPIAQVLQSLVPPMVGLTGLYTLWRTDEERRTLWMDYALLLGAALAVALFVTRAGAVAGAIAAVPFGWRLQRWLTQLGTASAPVKAGLGVALLIAALVNGLSGSRYWPWRSEARLAAPATERANECRIAEAAPVLAALPPGEILAPMDIGPQLLHDSPHTVVASAHHRGEEGMHFAIEIFLGHPGRARAALVTRGTDYVALCRKSNEVARFRTAAPDGVLAQLADGQTFGGLERVPVPATSNLEIWRIAP